MVLELSVDVTWTPAQHEIFFNCEDRFRIIPKGGRVGMTQGGAQAVIQWAFEDSCMILWGDTVHGNIRKYFQQYFLPILKKIDPPGRVSNKSQRGIWHFMQHDGALRIGKSTVHFRTKDQPVNWEGFSYKYIFINEAGIVLAGKNGEYIWGQVIRKMLMDNPKSVFIAAGVPKGHNTFKELADRGWSNDPKFNTWSTRTLTTFDNTYISRKEIQKFIDEENPELVRQEIGGEFIGGGDHVEQVISGAWVDLAFKRYEDLYGKSKFPLPYDKFTAWGVDPSRGGADETLFYPRYGYTWACPTAKAGAEMRRGVDVLLALDELNRELFSWEKMDAEQIGLIKKKFTVRVDEVGVGSSPADEFVKYYPNVTEIHSSRKTIWKGSKGERMANLRTAMIWNAGEILNPDNNFMPAIYPHPQTRKHLISYRFSRSKYKNRGTLITVEKKSITKKRIGESPDYGDAFVYSAADFAKPVRSISWRTRR